MKTEGKTGDVLHWKEFLIISRVFVPLLLFKIGGEQPTA